MSIRNRFTSVLFYCISAEYERGMVKRSEPCKVCCRGVENGKKIKAISCKLLAVSWQLSAKSAE